MEGVRQNIAKNLTELRQQHNMTQTELAEKLNYSDKAVSKWERAESLPDVAVLTQIADLFGISLDELVRGEATLDAPQITDVHPVKKRNRALITGMSVMLVWLLATIAFVTLHWLPTVTTYNYLALLAAAPASIIVWLIFNSIWFNPRRNYCIISLLLWVSLAAAFLTGLILKANIWLIFVIGIPAQIIILLWSGIGKPKKK